jgi:hypothetical protein
VPHRHLPLRPGAQVPIRLGSSRVSRDRLAAPAFRGEPSVSGGGIGITTLLALHLTRISRLCRPPILGIDGLRITAYVRARVNRPAD